MSSGEKVLQESQSDNVTQELEISMVTEVIEAEGDGSEPVSSLAQAATIK